MINVFWWNWEQIQRYVTIVYYRVYITQRLKDCLTEKMAKDLWAIWFTLKRATAKQ